MEFSPEKFSRPKSSEKPADLEITELERTAAALEEKTKGLPTPPAEDQVEENDFGGPELRSTIKKIRGG